MTSSFSSVGEGGAMAATAQKTNSTPAPVLRTLEDIAALAGQRGATVLKVHIENDMHLVSLEPGRIEFRPSSRAPRTLAADLAQKLKEWTGIRWVVTVAREGGAATLGDSRRLRTPRNSKLCRRTRWCGPCWIVFPVPKSSMCARRRKTMSRRQPTIARNDFSAPLNCLFSSPVYGGSGAPPDGAQRGRRITPRVDGGPRRLRRSRA